VSVLDTQKGIYYYVIETVPEICTLFGLSVKNGEIVTKIVLVPGDKIMFVEFLLLDRKTGFLYYLLDGLLEIPDIYRLDVAANKSSLVSHLDDIPSSSTPPYGLDSTHDWIFLQIEYGGPIHVYKLSTGELVKTIPDQFHTSSFNWDSKTGLMFGFGAIFHSPGNFSRVVVSINGTSGEVKQLSELDKYGAISESHAALDPETRSLTAYFNRKGTENYYLVSVNIDTGKINNEVLACNPVVIVGDCEDYLPKGIHYSNEI